MPAIEKMSINQITTRDQWNLRQAVEGYARHGVRGIALWREKIEECGIDDTVRILDDNGMTVSGLCRGGLFTAIDAAGRQCAIDDNRAAIETAAAVKAACLILVAGGVPEGSKDLTGARTQVMEALTVLLPEARAAGVALAIEPLHPMTCADRGCITTLAQANDMCDALGDGVGIAVDIYHVWWDPMLETQIARAGSRILAFHVNDWLRNTRDIVFDRGMMGDGVVDIPKIRSWVERAGFGGLNEVEIFSSFDWWKRDPDEVVATCIDRHSWAV